jgi:hypothetical protein
MGIVENRRGNRHSLRLTGRLVRTNALTSEQRS